MDNLALILSAIEEKTAKNKSLLIAIDGPCASGKSTLGARIAAHFNCPLFHMDDFFLQPEQRTPQRLSEAGGNVDSERFLNDVLTPLSLGNDVTYRPWLCRDGKLGEEISVPTTALAVVEGCYALRPDLRDFFGLKIFLRAPLSLRLARIEARNGAVCLDRFQSVWIPLEDTYFRLCEVAQCCDLVLDTPLSFS